MALQDPASAELYGRHEPFLGDDDLRRFTSWLEEVGGIFTRRLGESYGGAKVDCWVRTEHMHSDLSICLQSYEQRGGEIDWEAYRRAAGNATLARGFPPPLCPPPPCRAGLPPTATHRDKHLVAPPGPGHLPTPENGR